MNYFKQFLACICVSADTFGSKYGSFSFLMFKIHFTVKVSCIKYYFVAALHDSAQFPSFPKVFDVVVWLVKGNTSKKVNKLSRLLMLRII